jgi:hypothetical protein
MDFKEAYDAQLFQSPQMSLIKRFSLKKELFQPILRDACLLENIELFLNPLFSGHPDKIYNINKSLELQKPIRKKAKEETAEVISFDEEEWEEEKKRKIAVKKERYEKSLSVLIDYCMQNNGEVSLEKIAHSITDEEKKKLIPDTGTFKEIIVELLKEREINLDKIREEQKNYIVEESEEFRLGDTLFHLLGDTGVRLVEAERIEDGSEISFVHEEKRIVCSNIRISMQI